MSELLQLYQFDVDDILWIRRAFPSLPDAEAEEIALILDEFHWHKMRRLMSEPDPGGRCQELAEVYSRIISDLLADKNRKESAHRRRWLISHLADTHIERKGVGLTVTRWLSENDELCPFFGFPPGPKNKKRRSAIVTELLKEMRAAVRKGSRPWILNSRVEEELEVRASTPDLSVREDNEI
jgi:hypothetical protein